MKRIWTLTLILSIVSVGALAGHGGVTATVVGYYNVVPTIDGDLSDWPSGLDSHTVNQYLSGYTDPTGPTDFSCSFKAFFNPLENKLFVAVSVTDDEEKLTGDPAWLYDHLEVYLDGNHNQTGPGGYPAEFQQYIFPLDGTDAYINGTSSLGQTTWAFQKSGTDYTFEIAFVVWDIYDTDRTTLESGKMIGFDISWPDQDDATGDSWISWSPDGGKWNDSSLFGDITLGAMQDTAAAANSTWALYE